MSIEQHQAKAEQLLRTAGILPVVTVDSVEQARRLADALLEGGLRSIELTLRTPVALEALAALKRDLPDVVVGAGTVLTTERSEEHTSELQSLMRISYAVFCLKKKQNNKEQKLTNTTQRENSTPLINTTKHT